MFKQCIRSDLIKIAMSLLVAFGGTAALAAKGNSPPPPLAD